MKKNQERIINLSHDHKKSYFFSSDPFNNNPPEFHTSNSAASSPRPSTSDNFFSLFQEIIRILVKKIKEMEVLINKNITNNNKKMTQLIIVNEKNSIKSASKDSDKGIKDIEIMINKLDNFAKVSPFKLNQKPAQSLYEEVEIKALIKKENEEINFQLEQIKSEVKNLREEIAKIMQDYEEQLLQMIIAQKNSVLERQMLDRGRHLEKSKR